MKTYQLKFNDGEDFLQLLKIISAKQNMSMKDFIMVAVLEKINLLEDNKKNE